MEGAAFLLSAYGWELYGGRYDGVFFSLGGKDKGWTKSGCIFEVFVDY